MDYPNYPKLRHIEAFPVEASGSKSRMICLRDPLNLSGKVLFVPYETLFIISLFDGKHSILDIQKEFMGKFGTLIFRDDILSLVRTLDENLMLDNNRLREFKEKLEDEFRRQSVREPIHAGASYPDNANELRKWLHSFFRQTEEKPLQNLPNGKLRGIISPHIDLRRGWRSYALIYGETLKDLKADTLIIFGTSHYAESENPFILTKKNYVTPFGKAETDLDIVEELTHKCGWDLFEGEIAHRPEHSIEFQVVFLQYLFVGKKSFKTVPILCNSFHKMILEGTLPSEDERVSTFLDSMGEIVSSLDKRAFIIAGADLAHVGLKFGDPEPVTQSHLQWIRERDQISLKCAEGLDAQGFFRSIAEEKDRRRVCGTSPIYALLSTIEAKSGKTLDYDQALEPDTGSVVSFASAGFYGS